MFTKMLAILMLCHRLTKNEFHAVTDSRVSCVKIPTLGSRTRTARFIPIKFKKLSIRSKALQPILPSLFPLDLGPETAGE